MSRPGSFEFENAALPGRFTGEKTLRVISP
jgi:hypothetical protein